MLELFRAFQNPTAWAALAAFVCVLAYWLRVPAPKRETGALLRILGRLLDSRLMLAFLALGASWNVVFFLYEGYAVPRDVMQDIVSAQELLAGRSPYPHDMTRRIETALEREPPGFSVVAWSPTLLAKEQEARRAAAGSHWVQAHPPGMTLVTVPLVALFGIQGAYLAISALSLAALFLGLHLLRRGLHLHLTRRQALILALLVLGWFPVLGAIRNGQTGILLGTLSILCWYWLKTGRPGWAGVAVGVATCIKLYPGLLFVYLLARHRRAFAVGLATLVLLLCLPLPFAGWTAYVDHFETARGVVEEYAGYATNVGWLGFLVRLSGGAEGNIGTGRALWLGLGLVVVGAGCWLVRRGRADGDKDDQLDLECSLFVTLSVALSPIAWYHYLPVLLLPLAVLGKRVLSGTASPGAILGFVVLLLALAAPEPALMEAFNGLEGHLARYWRCLLLMPWPCVSITCLWLWLVRGYAGRREAVEGQYSVLSTQY